VSINRMCSQLKEMRQTIEQSERARLLAQLAAGLAHPSFATRSPGARHERPVARQTTSGPVGDETLSVALRQLAFIEEQVKGLLSPVGSSVARPRFATSTNSSPMSRVWSIRHASIPGSLSVSCDETGRRRSSSSLTGRVCARDPEPGLECD